MLTEGTSNIVRHTCTDVGALQAHTSGVMVGTPMPAEMWACMWKCMHGAGATHFLLFPRSSC